jgi:hypothetical protein
MNRPFQDALLRGHQAERDWVEEVRDEGRAVAHGKKLVQPAYNPGGAKCQHPDAVALVRVEVKQRDLKFTSPEDFPYPTAFVCNINNEAADVTTPLIYILRSAPTRCWVWVLGADRNADWTESIVRDTTRGSTLKMLSCPKSHLRPSQTLLQFLIAHDLLQLIDGDTTAFIRTEDSASGETDQKARPRKRKTPKKTG